MSTSDDRVTVHPPATWLADGGMWPRGPFRREMPLEARYAAVIFSNVAVLLAHSGLSRQDLASATGSSASDLAALLDGLRIPTQEDLAVFEAVLGSSIWPSAAQLAQVHQRDH